MPKVKEFFRKFHAPIWLGILVAVVLILRLPSFFEPYYYGDEMIYMTLGQGIRQGVHLYSGLHDNKPPLIYLLAALSGNLFWFKTILAAFNIASIILFWNLAKALFGRKERLIKISTIIFGLLTTLPLLEGNTVNAELLMVVPTLAGFLVLFGKKNTFKNLFLAGILFSLASLFKIPAAFDFPVIVVFWILASKFNLKKVLYLILGFLVPLSLSSLWFYLQGAGREYLTAAFLQNFGYVSSWRQGAFGQGNFITNNLPLIIRGVVVLLGTITLFVFRNKLSKQFIFLCLWLLFSLFAVTLSERPYPHYLIQALPALSFFLGIMITDKTLEQSLTVIPLFLFFFVPTFYHFWLYNPVVYYGRFLNYATGTYSKEEYFRRFNGGVNKNYEIAAFLASSSRQEDRVFVWGEDSPTIYALSKRLPPVKYVADYHVFDYSTLAAVSEEIAQKNPRFIVFLAKARPFPQLRALAQRKYLLIDNANGVEVWVNAKI